MWQLTPVVTSEKLSPPHCSVCITIDLVDRNRLRLYHRNRSVILVSSDMMVEQIHCHSHHF